MKLRRHSLRPCAASLLAAAVLLAAPSCGIVGGGDEPSVSPKNLTLLAGQNDPNDKTIALLMFLPQKIKVVVGANVSWTFNGPEPHTVTFVPAGGQPPSPNDPAATRAHGTPGPYDGTSLVSSGLLPAGTRASGFALTFTKAGTYNYVCTIHPAMTGAVEVVSGTAESKRTIRDRAKAERDRWLAEGRDAKKKFLATAPRTISNADGSTTYRVEMGTSTPHTAVLVFQPLRARIKAGDKVVFVNNDSLPHTATFAGTKQLPTDPESPQATAAAPGKSPQTLNATDFFNTGSLPPNVPPGQGPPEAARSFTFAVPTAGTYGYVCLPHQPSDMTGSIVAA